MKHLQTYRIFEASQSLTPEQEQFLNKHTEGTWSVNPTTGKVDVQGNFVPWSEGLYDLREIQFGSVTGRFNCSHNQLQSLEGAPETVGGDFRCFHNQLKSLKGAPTTVGGNFRCYNNRLESLEGAPTTVGGDFQCNSNELKSLEGAPTTVGGNFRCYNNKLESLEGAPTTVGGDFSCQSNLLKSLKGAPETIGGEFYSDDIKVPKGKWSLETLADLWIEGTPKQKSLLDPLVGPEALQQKVNKNPEKMLMKLKGVLKHPHFQGLKWPNHLETGRGLLSDLDDVGL